MVEFRAPGCIAIFRWLDTGQDQTTRPVVVGVTSGDALKAFKDFVLTEGCKRPPSGWERATYRGPLRTPPPGVYEIPRDFLDVSQGTLISAQTTVEEVQRVLSRRMPLLLGRGDLPLI